MLSFSLRLQGLSYFYVVILGYECIVLGPSLPLVAQGTLNIPRWPTMMLLVATLTSLATIRVPPTTIEIVPNTVPTGSILPFPFSCGALLCVSFADSSVFHASVGRSNLLHAVLSTHLVVLHSPTPMVALNACSHPHNIRSDPSTCNHCCTTQRSNR